MQAEPLDSEGGGGEREVGSLASETHPQCQRAKASACALLHESKNLSLKTLLVGIFTTRLK